MRLMTKINIYFGIILAALLIMIFAVTHYFFQHELELQTNESLAVMRQSFKLTIEKIFNEQYLKILTQAERDIIGITTKDRISSVLNYYLKAAARDYNLDLIEVFIPTGELLADNQNVYEPPDYARHPFKKPSCDALSISYLSRRADKAYLMTTSPIHFSGNLVGYMNAGTLIDQEQVEYFSSILHSELLFYADGKLLAATPGQGDFPIATLKSLMPSTEAEAATFLPGLKIDRPNFDYIFFPVTSDGSFLALVGLAKNRNTVLATMFRLKVFLMILTGVGFLAAFFGANALARNIKRSIFGMEPGEIASLLDQQTAILQSTFEGIIAVDSRGIITLINKEARRLLPSAPNMNGQPAEVLFSDLKINEALTTGQALYNRQRVIGETVIVYNCVPIKSKTAILGAVISLRDLTEFQKVAEELMEVKNYTQALRAQSHEYLNRMHSVSGLIQLGRYETALAFLHESTESHQEIISFLTKFFAAPAVSGILLGKLTRAKELNITFDLHRSSCLPEAMTGIDHELVCIIGNLIENAFEALQTSSVSPKQIRVRIRPSRHLLKIVIVDNGPGIPAEIKDRIFERGFTSKKGLNKGMGLSLVKQNVENLRGRIRFKSGRYTIFAVEIPFRKGESYL